MDAVIHMCVGMNMCVCGGCVVGVCVLERWIKRKEGDSITYSVCYGVNLNTTSNSLVFISYSLKHTHIRSNMHVYIHIYCHPLYIRERMRRWWGEDGDGIKRGRGGEWGAEWGEDEVRMKRGWEDEGKMRRGQEEDEEGTRGRMRSGCGEDE